MEISYKAFHQLAQSLEGSPVLTLKNKRPFMIQTVDDGRKIIFTPQSTGMPRPVRQIEIEGVLRNFFKIGSFIKKDYEDISRNASYILALIKHFTDGQKSTIALSLERVAAEHDAAVSAARKNKKVLAEGNISGNATPEKITVAATTYIRDPKVAAFVLERANGHCEACKQPAPFMRRSTGEPYLEVHHRKRLAEGGPDTIENAVALCPNCHREAHYGTPG